MARGIVVKVGTSTLSDADGAIDQSFLQSLADQLSRLADEGQRPVLVTSGAIRVGMDVLGWATRPRTVALRQAAAAVGQGRLMGHYADVFARHGKLVGQVLLTRQLAMERVRYVNAQNTLNTLLHEGVIPIVNENDTVAVEELQFGDNDTLGALVAAFVRAELLVLLTNVAGLLGPDGNVIPRLAGVTPEIMALAHGVGRWGSGGMRTKLEAARIAGAAGVTTVIASGRAPDILPRIMAGDAPGTWIEPAGQRLQGRKHWLAFGTRPSGSIVVNARAREAIVDHHRSLLPAGVVGVRGPFAEGDSVSLKNEAGEEFARGLAACDWRSMKRLIGVQSGEIEALTGRDDLREMVHRDDLVVLSTPAQETMP